MFIYIYISIQKFWGLHGTFLYRLKEFSSSHRFLIAGDWTYDLGADDKVTLIGVSVVPSSRRYQLFHLLNCLCQGQ